MIAVGADAQYKIGLSLGVKSGATSGDMIQMKDTGFDYVEVVINEFYRNVPKNELYERAFSKKKEIDEAGLKVWSCHLPFSKSLDISVIDAAEREKNIQFLERMIDLCKIFKPSRLVLHPSSEPISDDEREERIVNSRDAIGRLSLKAKETGAVLCVENLPRTCLGRDSDELLSIIAPYPDVMICFDSNHLLKESHSHFFKNTMGRIGTIHVSDYDRVDERHWIPGHPGAVIDWGEFFNLLKKSGYKGVFMFEVRKGDFTFSDVSSSYFNVIKKAYTNQNKNN